MNGECPEILKEVKRSLTPRRFKDIILCKLREFYGSKMLKKNKIQILLTVFFCLIIFPGCSIKDGIKKGSDEKALRQRVAEYWEYKSKEEFDKSYEFEDPYYRNLVSLTKYIRGINSGLMEWKSAEIKEIELGEGIADVELAVDIKLAFPGFKKMEHQSRVKEKWVNVDGMWYHVPEKWRRTQKAGNDS
jgi:hypothetical protein